MKIILQDNNQYIIRFDKGDEVFEGLSKFMVEQAVKACAFTGIGAADTVELAFYNPHLKDYRRKPFVEEMEVGIFSGTGSMKDGQPVIHAHGVFSRNDFSTLTGHVFKMIISVTFELHLTKLNGEMKKENNPDFNLNLLV